MHIQTVHYKNLKRRPRKEYDDIPLFMDTYVTRKKNYRRTDHSVKVDSTVYSSTFIES